MTKTANWFDVDKEGLAKLVADKPKIFIVHELLQNAWDQSVTDVRLFIGRGARRGEVNICVEDNDPEGFQDLAHAFTLFAESGKKVDPKKRGRFNLGEKLVLSLCRKASIMTTKGTIEFDEKGNRRQTRERTKQGSLVSLTVKMNKPEMLKMVDDLRYLIPPEGINTHSNTNRRIEAPKKLAEFSTTLPTQKADEHGVLRSTARNTKVRIYDVKEGLTPFLYEMGIPVVPIDCKWNVDVQQKVPLNMDRDNVTPAYYSKIMAEVVNHMIDEMTEDDCSSQWVSAALEHKDIKAEAVISSMDLRFGKNRVSYDPSDPEANQTAVSEGATVVHGKTLSKAAWENVRKAGAIVPAGQKFETPKPFTPGGKPLKVISTDDYTSDDHRIASFVRFLSSKLVGKMVSVRLAVDKTWRFNGAYGDSTMWLNTVRLGRKLNDDMYRVILHELAHEYSSSHLDKSFYEALNEFAVQVTQLAMEYPEKFNFLN